MSTDAPSAMLAKTPMDQKLAVLLAPSVEGMGFRLVRVRMMGGARPTLQIMAERPDGGMHVDECAELSRTLSAVLDVEDPIDREYVLEVSSPGIDRPLTRPEDFARYAGYEAKLETAALIDGRKRFRGRLLGLAGDGASAAVRLALGKGDGEPASAEQADEVSLPFSDLADAKLVLTDALIAESLKRGGGAGVGDGDEVDLDAEADFETEPDEDGNDDAEPDPDPDTGPNAASTRD